MNQEDHSDSAGRKPTELLLFGIGFIGFLIAATGITVSSPAIAMTGAVILLLTVCKFLCSSD